MKITHVNPTTLHCNPAFSQVVTVEGSGKTIYVGGQNAVNTDGKIIGDDLGTQTEQAMRNVTAALSAANATPKDVVKLTIYIVQGHSIQDAFLAARKIEGWNHPTAVTVLVVHALAHPKFLVEIEAIAAVKK